MVHLSFSRMLLLGALLAGLGACGGGPPPKHDFVDIRFTDQPQLRLDVQKVEVIGEYRPNFEPPHYEMRLPVPLPYVAENWARDRLRAVGFKGSASAAVIDANVVEIELPKESGFSASFTKQQDLQYEARVGMRVEIRDERGMTIRTATAHAERSITTLEGITLDERDRMLYRMEIELMADLDRQLET